MYAQLATGVVQSLVQGVSVRVQTLGEDVDRDTVERERNEDAALVWGEDLSDRTLECVQQLGLLGRLVGPARRGGAVSLPPPAGRTCRPRS
jgi:hypothetical protein